jgi:hypothetical protein
MPVAPPHIRTTRRIDSGEKGQLFMDNFEIQAKAVIAAALIASHAVEIPRIPTSGEKSDIAAIRLRDLTDYVYQAIVLQVG